MVRNAASPSTRSGGRAVTLEDDPLAWMVLERQRADTERERADAERERADAERERADIAEVRSAALEVELRRRGGD